MSQSRKMPELDPWTPRNERQRLAENLWCKSRIMFLLGPAGCGKTSCAFGLALRDLIRGKTRSLWLTRPAVDCDEHLGFDPGDQNEKMRPWLAPFADVFGSMTNAKFDDLLASDRIEAIPVGRLRGRTVDGVMVVDEAQNLTRNQLLCILTRLGKSGRIVICGDPRQSDLYKRPPLISVVNRLMELDGIETVWFEAADQMRDPLVSQIVAEFGKD